MSPDSYSVVRSVPADEQNEIRPTEDEELKLQKKAARDISVKDTTEEEQRIFFTYCSASRIKQNGISSYQAFDRVRLYRRCIP